MCCRLWLIEGISHFGLKPVQLAGGKRLAARDTFIDSARGASEFGKSHGQAHPRKAMGNFVKLAQRHVPGAQTGQIAGAADLKSFANWRQGLAEPLGLVVVAQSGQHWSWRNMSAGHPIEGLFFMLGRMLQQRYL